MADNYLEKRMEEYRAGKLAPKRAAAARPALKYPALNILLCGIAPELARTLADTLLSAGSRVSATADCGIAQGCGVRIYTPAADIARDLERTGTVLDAVVTDGAAECGRELPGHLTLTVQELRRHVEAPQAMALLILALAHPDSRPQA